jgi:hypothetical protein
LERPVTVARLRDLLAAPKSLGSEPEWRTDGDKLTLAAPIEIDGVTEEGLQLRGSALLRHEMREVTLGLVYLPGGETGGMFERIDAWPLHEHANKGHGPSALRFRTFLVGETHHHGLENNRHLPIEQLLNDLPVAERIDPQPNSWRALMRHASKAWNFEPDLMLTSPPWQPDLWSDEGTARRGKGRGQ